MSATDRQPDLDEIDLSRHDLIGLRHDVFEIFNLPRAAMQVARWAVFGPYFGTMYVWSTFADRMSGWPHIVFTALAAVGFIVAAVGIGLLTVVRSRIGMVADAGDRVIDTVSELHRDYLAISSNGSDLQQQELAALLTTDIVIPVLSVPVTRGVGFRAAPLTTGPIGWVLRPVSSWFIGQVERRVLEAISEAADDPHQLERGDPDLGYEAIDGTDLTAHVVTAAAGLDSDDWYETVRHHLARIVDSARAVTVRSMTVLVVVSALPATALLGLGWLLT